MKVMRVERQAPVENRPLVLSDTAIPEPRAGEVLIKIECCGICRTDLHVVEGELPPVRPRIVPGHQAVGRIETRGPGAAEFRVGQRVGVAWLNRSCGTCRYCLKGSENLCDDPRFTGYHLDGGYAEYMVAPEKFVYAIPGDIVSHQAAPLLCAGIIGYRAFCRSGIRKGGRLGLYGFGSSAHIVIQIARYYGCQVYVATREEKHRQLAARLGAVWTGQASEAPPDRLDGAILFAPAGELVPPALRALDKGGTLALAGIYVTDIPSIGYEPELFYEKTLTSVTANTRQDGLELMKLARDIPITTHTELFPLEKANEALIQLKHDGLSGSGVLLMD